MGHSCSSEGCNSQSYGCNSHCGRGAQDKDASRTDNSCQKYDHPENQRGSSFVEEPLDSDIFERKRSETSLGHDKVATIGGTDQDWSHKWADGVANSIASQVKEEKLQMKEEKLPLKDHVAKGESADSADKKQVFFSEGVKFMPEGRQSPGDAGDETSGALSRVDEEPKEGSPGEEAKQVDSPQRMSHLRATNLWKKAAKKVILHKNMGAKVAIENKIGKQLTGWYKDVGLELQRGIAAEGRCQVHGTFEVPEHDLFNRARVACGFPTVRYFATMGLQEGLTEPNLKLIGGQDAAGKSGSFFFLSPDQQLIAKSCTDEDWRRLLRILPQYVEYVEAARARSNQKRTSVGSAPAGMDATSNLGGEKIGACEVRGFTETLLPRFLGLYKLQVPGGWGKDKSEVKVLVMANVFGGAMSIDRRYDLKGSTHGRKASRKECAKKAPTFKDIDWVAAEHALGLSASNRQTLLQSIKLDLNFLQKNGLMDYSLLVGVHDIDKDAPRPYEAMNVVTVRDQSRHCYLGIIDVLTPYKMVKRAETMFLGKIVCGRDISCQHPKVYARRFLDFTDEQVFDLIEESLSPRHANGH